MLKAKRFPGSWCPPESCAPEFHDDGGDNTHQPRRRKDSSSEVAVRVFNTLFEQTLHATGEDALSPLFGVITLHHATAAKRFG